jgi:membrane fusion protein (multidrug efflux system)
MTPRCLPLALLVAAACSGHEPPPSEPDPTEATSAAIVPAPAVAPEFVAVVTSRKSQVIAAIAEGPITKIVVQQGQRVKVGDLVAELDTSELESKLNEAEAEKAAASSDAGAAGAACSAGMHQAALSRRMGQLGAVSREEFASKRAEAAGACGRSAAGSHRAQAAAAQIERYKKLIAGAKVTAPMDGVISVVKQKVGNRERVGEPIAQVVDPSDRMIRFAVPRVQRHDMKQGLLVELRVQGDPRPIHATIERVADEIDPTIEFTTVEADIADIKLHPDLQVGVRGHVKIADSQPAGGTL